MSECTQPVHQPCRFIYPTYPFYPAVIPPTSYLTDTYRCAIIGTLTRQPPPSPSPPPPSTTPGALPSMQSHYTPPIPFSYHIPHPSIYPPPLFPSSTSSTIPLYPSHIPTLTVHFFFISFSRLHQNPSTKKLSLIDRLFGETAIRIGENSSEIFSLYFSLPVSTQISIPFLSSVSSYYPALFFFP